MIKVIIGNINQVTKEYNEFSSNDAIEMLDKKVEILSHFTKEDDTYAQNYNVELVIVIFYKIKETK